MSKKSIYVGYDQREADAYNICLSSIRKNLSNDILIEGLFLDELQASGLYTRPTIRKEGKLIDVNSIRSDYEGAMSTEFAISRFLVPHIAREGWALFMDCDMLVRKDLNKVFELCDPDKALMCVKHDYQPSNREKMDGQVQVPYPRKNWSSFMIFNCDHPANENLTPYMINTLPGKTLHNFFWLHDDLIGELPAEWNFLVGEQDHIIDPAVVHFTEGLPSMKGYENCLYADEWRSGGTYH